MVNPPHVDLKRLHPRRARINICYSIDRFLEYMPELEPESTENRNYVRGTDAVSWLAACPELVTNIASSNPAPSMAAAK
jgi:hypothetical protein